MKVIKKGREQKGWAKEFKCTGKGNDGGGCGATLLVEQDDLIALYSHARDETTTYLSFECCECGVKTDVWNNESGFQCPVSHEILKQIKGKNEV